MMAKKLRIVIVGAGMAGLPTASTPPLVTSSTSASSRPTIRSTDGLIAEFVNDRIEMGATWIHGIVDSPIYAMAQDLQALTDPPPWEHMDGFPTDPLTISQGGTIVDPSRVIATVTALYCRLMGSARTGEALIDPKDPASASPSPTPAPLTWSLASPMPSSTLSPWSPLSARSPTA
ncbi:polyamine oxidase 1-like [Elaeis guineensis]|uniref:polyamine oxidase 1-like n=1 Tax=Elaeis guineensis var. tenera TaxID=51953 RepID=UPI00057AC6C9